MLVHSATPLHPKATGPAFTAQRPFYFWQKPLSEGWSEQAMAFSSNSHCLRETCQRRIYLQLHVLIIYAKRTKLFGSAAVQHALIQLKPASCWLVPGRSSELASLPCPSPGDACRYQAQGRLQASQMPASVCSAPLDLSSDCEWKGNFLLRGLFSCWSDLHS